MEPEPMRVLPSTGAITRLEQTFDWMLWITVEERKLIWLRAARVPWKAITWEFGCDRTTAWRRWTLALTKIACTAERPLNPKCCNTFPFDICNMFGLYRRQDGRRCAGIASHRMRDGRRP